MAQTKRQESKLKKFMEAKPKSVSLSTLELVKTSYLSADHKLPLVISPAIVDADLTAWARLNRQFIDEQLVRHGAILFRGFGINSTIAFQHFAEAVCDSLYDKYGDLPRESQGGKVYGSTPYPAAETILFHNESSHLHCWPMKILFHCVTAARRGGETPIVDCRRMFSRLSAVCREQFTQNKLLYVRNFAEGLDVNWEDFYRTRQRDEVERQCRESDTQWEWKRAGGLRTRQIREAVRRHPATGEHVFFNQVQLHHVTCLQQEVRRSLQSMYSEEDLPRNVYWGDGTAISEEVIDEVGRLYQEEAVSFEWEQGDVLLLDNMLVAHGRKPYEGERKIVVTMGEMRSEED
jgi:alpha-ketoglutarate-dependent taurine dioxygenase